MNTINGVPYAELIKKLQEIRPHMSKKDIGRNKAFSYIQYEHYQQAMDSVFGNDHYRVSYSEPVYRVLASGQEYLTIKCSLDITDDEGNVIKHCEGFGDKEIQYTKETGKVDVTNLSTSTSKAAFKDACKYLGIFGYYSGNGVNASAGDAPASNKAAEKNSTAEEKSEKRKDIILFKTQGNFFEAGDRDGKKVWKIAVSDKASNAVSEVIFYPNNYQSCVDWFNRLTAAVTEKPVTLRLQVKNCGEREGKTQYIFLKNIA